MEKTSWTVMIADGQQLVADLLSKLLKSFEGFEIIGVFTHTEALTLAANSRAPDLVLVDAGMPGSSEAVLNLTLSHAGARLIFIDSAYRSFQVKRAFDCGAMGYLTKRDSLEEFEASIRRVLAGEKVYARSPTADRDKRCPMNPGLLTDREVEVLTYVAAGFSARRCAEVLGISENTVQNHKARVMRKLNLHKNVDMTRYAVQNGLVRD
ncbi:MAG TPA: response regulator transcription factor [Pirellulales bacterium]|jgi:DNA-binding NarL/FixJ family response regulator